MRTLPPHTRSHTASSHAEPRRCPHSERVKPCDAEDNKKKHVSSEQIKVEHREGEWESETSEETEKDEACC